MTAQVVGESIEYSAFGPLERMRLLGLCAQLTGDGDVAEDITQDTLIRAWRHAHQLRDPARRTQWLFAIARKECLRWAAGAEREGRRRVLHRSDEQTREPHSIEQVAAECDMEVDLERDDLAALLDRALALLPSMTRRVLLEKYIQESPQSEIAARLGVSEGTVEARLHRGKLALRQVLTTALRQDAAAYGLITTDSWQETRMWCFNCGRARLVGRLTTCPPEFCLRCPACGRAPGLQVAHTVERAVVSGVKGFKPALSRLQLYASAYYRRALQVGRAPCLQCGRPMPLQRGMPPWSPSVARDLPGVHLLCAACGAASDQSLRGLCLALPEGQRFWRAHPRLRTLPERLVDVAGRAAVVTRFESVSSAAHFAVVSDRDTFTVISTHVCPTYVSSKPG